MLPSLQHCIMGNLSSHTWHTRSPASSQGNTLMYSFHRTHPATAVVSSLSPHLVNYKSALEAENCFLSGDHTLTAGSNPQRDADHDEKTVFSFVCVSVTFLRVTRCCVYFWVRRYTFDTLRCVCVCLCMYLKRLPSKINRNSNETAESEPPFLLFLFPLKQWLCMSWCVLSLFPFFLLQAKKTAYMKFWVSVSAKIRLLSGLMQSGPKAQWASGCSYFKVCVSENLKDL